MDDTEQMIVNELRRIDRAIERREKALQAASEKDGARTFPRRYVLDLPVDIPVSTEEPPSIYFPGSVLLPVSRSFVVDRDCKRFFCQQIVASLIVNGNLAGQSASLTPFQTGSQNTLLPFLWQVRDTSTNREWSDYPLPSFVLPIESMVGGYSLPAPAVLDPGTEVEVSLQPLSATNLLTEETVTEIRKISVIFSFVGFEVL
ncbi:MAG: hypothetical protein EBT03_07345 [Betaproteobacteria bacterium]|nr:hypothetical protein [Betaproteobacteria bacterium]NCA16484.1 hypothetical protein [Betaproteobacteria bacterium]